MASRDLKAKIKIEADTKQAQKNLGKLDDSVERTENSTKSLGATYAKFAAGLAVAAAAISSLVRVFSSSFAAAKEQEQAIAALDNQLRSLGDTAGAVSAELQAQASALQSVSLSGDEAIISAQAQIAVFTKQEDQIKALTAASIDFNAIFGLGLSNSAILLAKTFGSSTNALSRYGFTVEGAAGSVERFNSLMQAMAKTAGAAAAQVDTFSGQIDLLSRNIGDMSENMAEVITQNGLLKDALSAANEELADTNTRVDESVGLWDKFNAQFPGTIALLRTMGLGFASVENAQQDMNSGLVDGIKGLFGYGKAVEDTAKTTNTLEKAQRSLNEVFAEATGFLNANTDALSDEQKAQEALKNSIEGTKEALRDLGVTLEEDVNAELKANEVLLEKAEILYRQGGISLRALEEAELAVGIAREKSNVSLGLEVAAFEQAETQTLSYADTLRLAREELDRLTESEARNAETSVEASERRRRARQEEQREVGDSAADIGGGTFFLPAGATVEPNGRVTPVIGGRSAARINELRN